MNRRKITIFILVTIAVFSGVGYVAALNGYFGSNSPTKITPSTKTDALVGHWKFDEGGNAQIVQDSSASGNNGTRGTSDAEETADPTWRVATNTPSWANLGSTLDFDGSDDYVRVPDDDSLSFNNNPTTNTDNPFSVAGWVNMRETTNFRIVTKGSTGGNNEYVFEFNVTENMQFLLYDDATANFIRQRATAASGGLENTWAHIAATYDGSGSNTGIILYINGTVEASSAGSGGTYIAMNNEASAVTIGRLYEDGANYSNGQIDDVRLYAKELTAGEIKYLYNGGAPVGHWRFDEGSGGTAFDSSGNGNDGTLIDISTSTIWVTGKHGTALDFDGVDEYVLVQDTDDLSFGNGTAGSDRPFSVTAWVNMDDAVQFPVFTKGADASREYRFDFVNPTSQLQLDLRDQSTGASIRTRSDERHEAYNGRWIFVGATYDGSAAAAGINLYRNGVLIPSTDSDSASYVAMENLGGGASVGRLFTDLSIFADGIIDDVRIYDYARTPDEIRLDYNAGLAAKFGGSPSKDINRGLVGYWKFDEGAGQIVKDSSTGGNDGFRGTAASEGTDDPTWNYATGDVATKAGLGSTLDFDGTDDFVEIPDDDSLTFCNPCGGTTGDQPFSIMAWVNMDGLVGESGMFGKGTNVNREYLFMFDGSDKLNLILYDDSGSVRINIVSDNGFSSDVDSWVHVAATYNGNASTSGLTLYRNGAPMASATNQAGTYEAMHNQGNAAIGRHWFNISSNESDGQIDSVRIYNRELTAAEIRYLYNRGGPVGHWKFDEGSGGTAFDSSGNGNDGTLLGDWGTTSTSWVAGKHGTSLDFDGVDDYIDVPHDAILNPGNSSFSSSFWIFVTASISENTGILKKDGGDYYIYEINSSHIVFASIRDNPTGGENFFLITGNTAVTLNTWNFIEFVIDRDGNEGRIYLNGVLDGITNISTMDESIDPPNALRIALHTAYFPGKIDDVRIYSYARTPDEIKLDYNAGLAAKFGGSPSKDINRGLVGYWKFDEGAGTFAADSSGEGNDGTLTYMATSTNGGWSYATGDIATMAGLGPTLDFDGTDDSVEVADDDSLSFGDGTNDSPFSITAWVNMDNATNFTVLAKGSNSAPEYRLLFDGSDNLALFLCDGTCATRIATISTQTFTSDENSWIFVAVIYDGNSASDGITLYRNGVLLSTSTNNQGTYVAMDNTAQSAVIARFYNDGSNFADGTIDSVRIYNRALSASEVRYLYNKGKPIGHWKFEEGSGVTANDSSGNGNTGTLTYMATSTPTGGWTTGKYGGGLEFDGVDDYVGVSGVTGLPTGQTARTVSFWMYQRTRSTGVNSALVDIINGGSGQSYTVQMAALNDSNCMNPGIAPNFYLFTDSVNGNNNICLTGSQIPKLNTWQHVTMTFDGSSAFSYYLNGVLSFSGVFGTAINTNTSGVDIGRRSSALIAYSDGLIDDVRIYNYARSPDEIRQDYNAGLGTHFR